MESLELHIPNLKQPKCNQKMGRRTFFLGLSAVGASYSLFGVGVLQMTEGLPKQKRTNWDSSYSTISSSKESSRAFSPRNFWLTSVILSGAISVASVVGSVKTSVSK